MGLGRGRTGYRLCEHLGVDVAAAEDNEHGAALGEVLAVVEQHSQRAGAAGFDNPDCCMSGQRRITRPFSQFCSHRPVMAAVSIAAHRPTRQPQLPELPRTPIAVPDLDFAPRIPHHPQASSRHLIRSPPDAE